MHFVGFVDTEDMNVTSGKRKYTSLVGYAGSKLAQVYQHLLSFGLRFPQKNYHISFHFLVKFFRFIVLSLHPPSILCFSHLRKVHKFWTDLPAASLNFHDLNLRMMLAFQVKFSSILQKRIPAEAGVNVICVTPGIVLTNVVSLSGKDHSDYLTGIINMVMFHVFLFLTSFFMFYSMFSYLVSLKEQLYIYVLEYDYV